VTLPDSLTEIGDQAFSYCYNLQTVHIGSGLPGLGDGTFTGCPNLTAFTVHADNLIFSASDGVLFNKEKTRLIAYPNNKAADYVIPDGVVAINDAAFFDCPSLQSITLPESLTSIGKAAFYYCSALKTVTFEGGAPTIADNAFTGVNSATCRYPSNDSSWIGVAYQNYGGTLTWESYTPTSGVCGDDLTWVFSGDGTLTISGTGPMYDWNYSSDVPWYGHKNNIKTIVIEEGATTVGNCAFYSCYSLISIDLPDSITSIGEAAFDYCDSLQSITLPQNLTTIGAGAFQGCYSLTSIELPDSLTAIGSYAFQYCESLTAIEIPEGVTAIGDRTFSDCTKLASIDLPDSLTAIGEYAFAGCSVQSITIPAKVETISDAAFYYCRSLTAFTVDANNEQYVSVGGVLFNRDKTILKVYPAGKTDTAYAIPDTVTTVEAYAFSGCTSLQSISLPNGLTTIGEYAFSSCTSLTSVAFPQTLSTLGESAFQYCIGLKTISFGGSAPETGSNAFSNVTATCYYLASNPTWTESKRTNMGSKLTWVGVGAAGYEAAKLKNGYYEISNLSQLYWFAQYVNDGHPSANGRLVADITANTGDVMAAGTYSENTNYLQWTPIAAGTTYTGTFDGNGHTIRGLYYYCKDYSQSQTRGSFGGLFHNVSGTVKDLTLDNCFFYHYNYAASICRQNSGTVENCTVTAYISTKGNYDHGGIAYRNMESGTIADCTFHGRGTTASSAYNGICNTNNGTISGCVNYSNHVRAGIASSNYGTISNCHNYGFISGHNTSVGGICAWSNGTIIDCTNAGEINAIYMNTGGICGSNSGLIRRCINTAEISSSSTYTGGICGSNGGDQVCGGIIQSCSNTGSVYSSYSYTGGICGSNSGIVTGSCNSGSFYGNVANTGSICGCNEVRYMHDGSGETKLYDMTGTVVNCISYYGSSIIGTATDGSFAKNNHTRSSLGNMSPAWLMNGMTTHGDLDWYQNIDNGKTPDSRAVLDDTHGTVYRTEGGVYTNTPQADDRSGSCGWNMEWSLDESGTLTITGSGTMDHFAPTAAPWYPYRNEIRTVRLEGNITSIGNYAFYDCSALTRVELGVNVTSIGNRAFALCTGLEEFYYGVSFLNAVIGTCAFYGCTALETFALPVYANVGNYAFENCPALNSIYINYYSAYSPNITAGYESFTDVSATLYYPEGMDVPTVDGSNHGGTLNPVGVPYGPLSLDADWAYDAATGTLTISGSGVPQEYGAGDSTPWRGLQSSITRVVVEEGITGISNHLFEFMRQAETIDLPDSLTYLPYTAFNDCESLTHLRIPSGVTSMGNNYGFIRCDKLTDVYYVGTAGDWAQVEYSEYFRNDAAAVQLHCLILHEDAPTCTEPGTEAYYAFDDRTIYGEMYDLDMQIITQPETIPAKNHADKYTVEGTAATCTESGLTDGIYCPDCVSWLTAQTEIPAKNHAGKYTVEGTAATCTESGLTDGIYCPDCASWLTAQTEIPAKNHAGKYTVEGTAATCTESGLTDGICCPDCESWLTAQTEIPAKNHAGKYTVEGTAATCTESGLTDGIYCPDCESWLTAQTEIPAKNHSKRYQIIDFELYYACDNCAERTVARSVVWNDQGIVVRMEAETQTMLLYSALYDSHGCMIEVRIDEVTRNEMALSFEQLEDAAKVRVFFLNRDRIPVLTFLEPLKTEFMQ